MGDSVDRKAATQAALEFIVEYLGGAFDEELQKKLMGRMNALPSAQPDLDSAYTEGYTQAEAKYRALWDEMPKIIRCKDCEHSKHWYGDKRRCFLWHETGIDVFEDGYCNYAERRTDEID